MQPRVSEYCRRWASRRSTQLRCSANTHVGPSRHTRRTIFSMATRPGFCHVLPWLGWSQLATDRNGLQSDPRIHTTAADLARHVGNGEFGEIWHHKMQITSWRGATSRKPALQKEPFMVLATLWTSTRDTQKLDFMHLRWICKALGRITLQANESKLQSSFRCHFRPWWLARESGTHRVRVWGDFPNRQESRRPQTPLPCAEQSSQKGPPACML